MVLIGTRTKCDQISPTQAHYGIESEGTWLASCQRGQTIFNLSGAIAVALPTHFASSVGNAEGSVPDVV
ncbi:hypothetical protein [Azospirillum brasilense]|uniref:hypothetical protein n=1 Tax=Azospirillum brasilense TaxID=192 RepID=UPI0015568E5E|nr:hypothetical protein [Azospirillum brasilense]